MVSLLAFLHIGLFLNFLANIWYLRAVHGVASLSNLPSLSVLIPARNEEQNLKRLLPSLLAQDYPDFEARVYDDGSEDGTWGVLQATHDDRLVALRGEGPPAGWVGKVHALYQATRDARGALYLFLDADAELLDDGALRRLVARQQTLPPRSVFTGLTRLLGGGKLLVSLVPNAILLALPWPLIRPVALRWMGALNGQCWMIEAATYHHHEPHEKVKDNVLEDVHIGRYFKGQGITPVLCDVQKELAIYMYRDHAEAWRGFRKNAYLLAGGTPWVFALLFTLYLFVYVLAPFFSPWFLLSLFLLKAATDYRARFPLWLSVLFPVSYLLGSLLQIDSALHHWTGRVSWKGRRVGNKD